MQNSTGDAGNVTVNAKILELLNGSYISSSTFARGKAGDVIVTSDNLTIDDNRADLFPRIASNAE